jgi:large subunit ribosomal protein L15
MKIKKRKKSTRYRGSQTHRRGNKKRTRGLGNQGGKGWSGTGKRGDQKKTLVIKLYGNEYFGKDKALRRGRVAPKLKIINLSEITSNLDSFMKQGIAKEEKGKFQIDLTGYKILGNGSIGKITIKASSASKQAIDKVKAVGGEIIFPTEEAIGEKKQEVKRE